MARIALVTSSYLPRIGGVEEHVAHVADGLARRGHEVFVWSVDQGDPIPEGGVGVSLRMLPCPLPSRSIRGVARFAWRTVPAWFAWRRAFRLDRPDVVHVHCFGPNGVYATHFAGTRRLVYSHHGETFMDSIFDRSRLLGTRLTRMLNRADAVSSCSAFSARDLERFGRGPSDVVVVPNGVDLDAPLGLLPRGMDGATPFVLGIGRLVAVKGFDTLIRAFAQIVGRGGHRDVNLVIAGDGPQRSELEQLARDLGIASRVTFPGALSRPEVGAAMAAAEVLVVPSRVEAFGITILEGWRAGTPVIATRNGGPAEIIRDGEDGILVDPVSVEAIAEAIELLLSDSRLAVDVGQRGRTAAGDYTWDRTVSDYEEIYARLGNR